MQKLRNFIGYIVHLFSVLVNKQRKALFRSIVFCFSAEYSFNIIASCDNYRGAPQ